MKQITDAAFLSGLSQADVSNLIHSKVIVPKGYSSYGNGSRALLDDKNIKELQIVKRLRLAGVRRGYIKGVLELLRKSKQAWSDGWIVFNDGAGFFVTSNPFEVNNLANMKKNQITVIVKI